MNFKKVCFAVLLLLILLGCIHLVSRLYFLSTAESYIFDDGARQVELLRYDARTLPVEIDSAINMSNKTGILYSYSVLNGKMLSRAPYTLGLIDGIVSNWCDTGVLRTTCSYVAGKMHGEFCQYYHNGGRKSVTTYNMDRIVKVQSWFQNGSQKSEMSFHDLNDLVQSSKRWNDHGVLIESYLTDINQNPTSGFIHVKYQKHLSGHPIAFDVVGKTNFAIKSLDYQ